MPTIAIELPDGLLKALKEKTEREGRPLEEAIGEATLERCNVEDLSQGLFPPKAMRKVSREGDELLTKGNHVRASEKFWGPASQAVKVLAAKRGMELRSHGELHAFAAKLEEETGDPEIRRLWQSAGMLHQNLYENWLPPKMVEENAEGKNSQKTRG